MADEGKLREQAEIGRQAQAVLENARFKAAFESIEKFLIEGIAETATDEQQLREYGYLQLRLLRKLREVMHHEMIRGDGAMKELVRIKDPPKLVRKLTNVRW